MDLFVTGTAVGDQSRHFLAKKMVEHPIKALLSSHSTIN
jgi:hypothetical protein